MPQIRVWDVNTCEQVAAFPGHKYGINCVVKNSIKTIIIVSVNCFLELGFFS